MTSACSLKFDGVEISIQKAGVPDEFIFLFQEEDRRVSRSSKVDADDYSQVGYFARRFVVLQRLELGGYTSQRSEAAFNIWLEDERRSAAEFASNYGLGHNIAAELSKFTYQEWGLRLKDVLLTRYDLNRPPDAFVDEIDMSMRSPDQTWIFFADFLTSIRAMLDVLPVYEISLDVTELIHAGWLDLENNICEERRLPEAQFKSVLQPTVILAEGSTDNLVLKRSLWLFYPHLADFITFFDYEETNADGGASYQVKFLRAFAAARINTSIIAIFDNDAVGLDALNTARKLKLPEDMMTMTLPNIELARAYPTIGPQGCHDVDVNGKAVGIEMFLGRHNLIQNNGTLMPVVWGNYVPNVQAYQGRVDDKRRVLELFLKDTQVPNPNIDYTIRYPELILLWEHIFFYIKSRRASLLETYSSE